MMCVRRPVVAAGQATGGEAAAENSVSTATRPAEEPERRRSAEQGTQFSSHTATWWQDQDLLYPTVIVPNYQKTGERLCNRAVTY